MSNSCRGNFLRRGPGDGAWFGKVTHGTDIAFWIEAEDIDFANSAFDNGKVIIGEFATILVTKRKRLFEGSAWTR